MSKWYQEVHDFLGQQGFPCDDGEQEKSSRFPDEEKRKMAVVHNAVVAAGATCSAKKSAVARGIADVLRKAGDKPDNTPLTPAEIAAAPQS
jgi:hypothetical protein